MSETRRVNQNLYYNDPGGHYNTVLVYVSYPPPEVKASGFNLMAADRTLGGLSP